MNKFGFRRIDATNHALPELPFESASLKSVLKTGVARFNHRPML
jgi:hypothetical protein